MSSAWKKKPATPTFISEAGFHFEYTLTCFREVPYGLFLSSGRPEEKYWLYFGAYRPEAVLRMVIDQVRHISGGVLSENKYLSQLRVIVQLRNLTNQFDTIQTMMKTDNEKWSYLIEITQKLLRVSDAGDDERIDKLLDLLWRYLIELEKIKDSGTVTGYLLIDQAPNGNNYSIPHPAKPQSGHASNQI